MQQSWVSRRNVTCSRDFYKLRGYGRSGGNAHVCGPTIDLDGVAWSWVKVLNGYTSISLKGDRPVAAHQEGALESSKSAINTLAPEFRALITILRSGGPVISTRLSSRSVGSFPTCQVQSSACLALLAGCCDEPWLTCPLAGEKSILR